MEQKSDPQIEQQINRPTELLTYRQTDTQHIQLFTIKTKIKKSQAMVKFFT